MAGSPIDRKLAAAATRISGGEPGRALTQASSAARGRVILALVSKRYAAGHTAPSTFDINHIQQLVLRDESLESFQSSWAVC